MHGFTESVRLVRAFFIARQKPHQVKGDPDTIIGALW